MNCMLSHLVGQLLTFIHDARTHERNRLYARTHECNRLYARLLPHTRNTNGSPHSPSFQRPGNILRTSTNHEGPHYAITEAVLTSSRLGLNVNDDSATEQT